jgi:CRP/FNR family transcriptional regulator, cyclic AMP receptor protein
MSVHLYTSPQKKVWWLCIRLGLRAESALVSLAWYPEILELVNLTGLIRSRRVSSTPQTPRQEDQTKSHREVHFRSAVFLETAGVARDVVKSRRSETIYSQGDPAKGVNYIQKGGVKLSVVNADGKEAVVAILRPSDFFGERCLAGQPICVGTARAIAPTSTLFIEKTEMMRLLGTEHTFSDRFISHMLTKSIRIQEDLLDQLFNSSEKRLARTLLLLARYRKDDQPQGLLPKVSQETLAEMIGATRSRVNFL